MSLSRRNFLRAALAAGGFGVTPALRGQTSSYLRGIDISHWQGTINWSQAKASGLTFAFCKATEGTTYVDPTFATNWAAMKQVGLVRGAYHFGRPGSDPVVQGKLFVDTVKPAKGDLQLVLDLEATDGLNAAQVWLWTQKFAAQIQKRTARPGIIYCSPSFWMTNVGNPTNNLNCALWIANWNVTSPTVPRAWSGWTFWQYSSTGSTPGISGNVDQDYFNGSLTQLQKLTLP